MDWDQTREHYHHVWPYPRDPRLEQQTMTNSARDFQSTAHIEKTFPDVSISNWSP